MRVCRIDNCEPGMKLAQPVLRSDGEVLVGANVTLTEKLINRLKQLHVTLLYIHDPETEAVEAPGRLSGEILKEGNHIMRVILSDDVHRINKRLKSGKLNNRMELFLQNLYDEIRTHKHVSSIVMNLYVDEDQYGLAHALNVCIYTLILGAYLKLPHQSLYQLGMGGMLLDIGMSKIPKQIINKPSALTDEETEEVMKHTIYGYKIMTELGLPSPAALVALQHHERVDSTGYPNRLRGSAIHQFSKIAAIADTYHALISQKGYRRAYLPHEALELIYTLAGTYFDMDYVVAFREVTSFYPEGTVVYLNNGEKAVVVSTEVPVSSRPIVRVLNDPKGGRQVPFEINLSENLTVHIIGAEA